MMSGYQGKWMQVIGVIANMTENRESVAVSIFDGVTTAITTLWFEGQADKLELANQGDILVANGKIAQIRLLGINLENCELIKIAPGAPLIAKTDVKPPSSEQLEIPAHRDERAKPPISDAALKAWHSAFLLAYPAGSKSLAEKSAQSAFPEHHVARERVRELFPDAARGRPRKNIDLRISRENDGD